MTEEEGGGGYLAGKVLLPMSPPGKGIYRDVEERVDISKVLAKVERDGLLFFPSNFYFKVKLNDTVAKTLLRNYDKDCKFIINGILNFEQIAETKRLYSSCDSRS